jgi:hypothetical protein
MAGVGVVDDLVLRYLSAGLFLLGLSLFHLGEMVVGDRIGCAVAVAPL